MGLVFLDHEEVKSILLSVGFTILKEFLKYALYFKNKPQQDELMTTEDLFFRVSIQVFHKYLFNAAK